MFDSALTVVLSYLAEGKISSFVAMLIVTFLIYKSLTEIKHEQKRFEAKIDDQQSEIKNLERRLNAIYEAKHAKDQSPLFRE